MASNAKKSAGKKPPGKGRKPSKKGPAAKAPKGKAGSGKRHTLHEGYSWTESIIDYPQWKDSATYLKSRKNLKKVVTSTGASPHPWYFGAEPYEDHHGGGLWVKDEQGWFMVKNLAGMEWSSQFCADPKKVDLLRQNAKRLYDKFPLTAQAFKEMGFDLNKLLNTPIKDANGVAQWTDSICNASVPLPKKAHTGVLPEASGVHHYPTPITDIVFFKYDDFELFVTDDEGQPAAVLPVARRGSGKGSVEVVFATPGTKLHEDLVASHKKMSAHILPSNNPMAKLAFIKQTKKGTTRKGRRK
jgi:hypothetical protein